MSFDLEKTVQGINIKKGDLLIIRVGSEERPASSEDIQQVLEQTKPCMQGKGIDVFVTHHAIDFEVFHFENEEAKKKTLKSIKDKGETLKVF